MRNRLVFSVLLICLAATLAQAADVSGLWVAQIPGRDGNTMETTFNLKQSGESLSGSMANQFGERQISDGKVTGDDVAFNVKIEFNGNEFLFVYKGKAGGNEIKFTRERKGGDFGGPTTVEFVAKKK
jgi:hypothetical protein